MGKVDSKQKLKLPAALREEDRLVKALSDETMPLIVNLLGQKWALHILYSLQNGPCRYNGLCREFGINPATLSERLGELLKYGIAIRTVLEPGPPPVVQYTLTPKGHELAKIFEYLDAWTHSTDFKKQK
ncbi:MAG: helix-turn-helix transcriptional regulator [Fimbriimonadaceae bacterium]|nr:helix-turn-helix transcriptional regulator [Fimbriimonadaceae bacterium]